MPDLRTTLAVRLLSDELLAGLRSLLGPIDSATAHDIARRAKWISLESGDVLCRQGEPGSSLYLVISGRLRAVHRDADGRDRVVGEVGRAESVGEMAFFSGESRSATLYALRDSVLIAFSRELFESIVARHPQVTTGIIRVLIERLQRSMRPPSAVRAANVAVLPIHPDFPLGRFAGRLAAALSAHGPTLHLSSERLDTLLGMPGAAQASPNDAQGAWLTAALDEREAAHRFVVYEADRDGSGWTRRCVRQADRVLLVAGADGDPAPGQIERVLSDAEERITAHRTLVLVHRDDERLPSGTRRWLAARRVKDHLHLRGDTDAEIARVARSVAGAAVGLVLGGGGARGFAHVGVIRALREAAVPIDMVGGTSAGAFIGAQCAIGLDYEAMLAANRRIWLEVRPHHSVTLPIISVVANRKAMECAQMIYEGADIEDCWLDYFCVSSSLTTAEMVVHRAGPLGMAALASASLPVFAPPIADGRHLLVDGGLVNNLPCDVMRDLGAGRVIACDVSPGEDETFTRERVPSTWEALRGRFGGPPAPFPSLVEVLVRSVLLGSIRRDAEALKSANVVLQPPVARFRLLDMARVEEIAQVGYDYAKRQIDDGAITWN
jgi:predicted acylesterase/phospholipase RssA/CRP-like cAMP-binding protein